MKRYDSKSAENDVYCPKYEHEKYKKSVKFDNVSSRKKKSSGKNISEKKKFGTPKSCSLQSPETSKKKNI